jgi:hypothetical protein
LRQPNDVGAVVEMRRELLLNWAEETLETVLASACPTGAECSHEQRLNNKPEIP